MSSSNTKTNNKALAAELAEASIKNANKNNNIIIIINIIDNTHTHHLVQMAKPPNSRKALRLMCFFCCLYNSNQACIMHCMECQKGFHVNCFVYYHHCHDYPRDFVPSNNIIVAKLNKHFQEQAMKRTRTRVSKHNLLGHCNIELPTIEGKAWIVSKAKLYPTTMTTTTTTTAAAEAATITETTLEIAQQEIRTNKPTMITARALDLERQDCVLTRRMRENIINKTAMALCILTRLQ